MRASYPAPLTDTVACEARWGAAFPHASDALRAADIARRRLADHLKQRDAQGAMIEFHAELVELTKAALAAWSPVARLLEAFPGAPQRALDGEPRAWLQWRSAPWLAHQDPELVFFRDALRTRVWRAEGLMLCVLGCLAALNTGFFASVSARIKDADVLAASCYKTAAAFAALAVHERHAMRFQPADVPEADAGVLHALHNYAKALTLGAMTAALQRRAAVPVDTLVGCHLEAAAYATAAALYSRTMGEVPDTSLSLMCAVTRTHDLGLALCLYAEHVVAQRAVPEQLRDGPLADHSVLAHVLAALALHLLDHTAATCARRRVPDFGAPLRARLVALRDRLAVRSDERDQSPLRHLALVKQCFAPPVGTVDGELRDAVDALATEVGWLGAHGAPVFDAAERSLLKRVQELAPEPPPPAAAPVFREDGILIEDAADDLALPAPPSGAPALALLS